MDIAGATNATSTVVQALGRVPLHHYGPNCDIRNIGARSYHWNWFRYLADFTHIAAVVLCLLILLRGSGSEGVSLKTHALFLVIFTFKYLNVFVCRQFLYLLFYKVGFWLSTLLIVVLLMLRPDAARREKDTCSIQLLIFPMVVATLLCAHYHSVLEVLWIFAQHLEGFAVLPQYIYCYRDSGNRRSDVLTYVLCLGGYRTLYGINWIYKYFFNPGYVDLSSWISGIVNVIFFSDFLQFKLCHGSPLSRFVLTVDDGIRDAKVFARNIVAYTAPSPGTLRLDCPQVHGGVAVGQPMTSQVELSKSMI